MVCNISIYIHMKSGDGGIAKGVRVTDNNCVSLILCFIAIPLIRKEETGFPSFFDVFSFLAHCERGAKFLKFTK